MASLKASVGALGYLHSEIGDNAPYTFAPHTVWAILATLLTDEKENKEHSSF